MSALIPHRAASLYEIDRGLRLQAEMDVDALLARVSQPEPVQMCAVEDKEPAALTRTQLAVIVICWCAAMYGASWLAGWTP